MTTSSLSDPTNPRRIAAAFVSVMREWLPTEALVAIDAENKRRVEADPNDRTEWPFIGSVVDYVAAQQKPSTPAPLPRNIALPFPVYAHVNFRLLGGPCRLIPRIPTFA